MKNRPYSRLRRPALALAVLGLLQAAAPAQFDSEITNISVTQAIQNTNVPYVAERHAFIRVETALTDPPGGTLPVDLDGLLRVYVNGVEAPDSPVFSFNGPYPAQLSSNTSQLNGTLNFVYLPPIAADVVFEVELNPAGPNFVPESNLANNTMSVGPLNFVEHSVPEFAYSPIDYRPSGGGANLPPTSLIVPGVGDNFIQGIYPVKDIYYHRTDAPSKLWTADLSGSGTGLLNSLQVDLSTMVPKPDFLYAWVPGGLPYNGVSYLNSSVAMGNTQSWKSQRTFAHEVGHNIGRNHVNLKISVPGIDTERHLGLPTSNGLGMLKAATLNDIMVAGLNTNQAWVRSSFYIYAYNYTKFQANDDAADAPEGPATLITGVWNPSSGAVQVTHVLDIPSGSQTAAADPAASRFVVTTYADGRVRDRLPLAAASEMDSCGDRAGLDSNLPLIDVPLQFTLARGATPIDRVEIVPVAGVQAQTVTLVRSANAPTARFLEPGPGGDVSAGLVRVSWTAADADGDPLSYYLRYSRDGVQFSPLATGIQATQFDVDLRQLPALVDGQGFFQLLVSDGLNTTVVDSEPLTGGGKLFANVGNDPWVEIVTPDPDSGYLYGSTVILHSSGWDLEDRALGDPAITWSSNVDGALGTGRLISVNDLTVGNHLITVTATDSDGNTATDTHIISIAARSLPDVPLGPEAYCTAGTSASGCQALISASGTPSASAASGFTLDITGVEGQKDGLYFFGANGRQANPWGSGTSFQCVAPPVKRAGLLIGVGTVGTCDGTFSQDLNARWQSKPAQNPGAGAVVQAQLWYRDPLNTSNQTTSLSDALEFTVQP